MAAIPSAIQQLWLRRIFAQTSAGGGTVYTTLILALQTVAFASLDAVKGGTVASTTKNGHAVSFSNRDNGGTPDDYAALGGEMLELYDSARADLVASGITSPTDLQIYTEMLFRLRPVTSFRKDYSTMRFAEVASLTA